MSAVHPLRCPQTGALVRHLHGTRVYRLGDVSYPQLDGIPTFQCRARSGAELDAQLCAIRAGGRGAVFDWLGGWCDSRGLRLEALTRVISPDAGSPFLADWAAYCGTADHYFLIRWACPSYLCNLAFLQTMAGKRVACLASGVGHLSNLVRAVTPRPRVTIVDGNLIHLLAARAYLAPGDQAICAELDDPLPLPDETFDVVTMNDAFHYIEAQPDLLREAFRILKPGGEAIVLHIHDPRDLRGETMPGLPVAPIEFSRMAAEAPWEGAMFYAELDLSIAVAEGRAQRAPACRDPGDLPPGPYAVCLRKPGRQAGQPWRLGLDRRRLLANPIYAAVGNDGYRIDWRGSDRNVQEFGHTPLPATLGPDAFDGDAADLVARGLLVPDPGGRLGGGQTWDWGDG